MAVFVRIFRLAMLFFNVYESYKVLKLPPPSTSNRGKPSLRAMSQRKRDMKGSLAVWIVWSCFINYERFAEAVISLFIPFYDEFKSLVMLFLIMTRARGAEPIYLHIIRPFLKPYTSTIDQLLDFAHVVGDVVLGLATLPFIYIIEWWKRRFGNEPESLDTETEASSSPVSTGPAPKTRLPVSRTNTSKSMKATVSSMPKPRQLVPKRSSLALADQKKGQLKAPQPQYTDKETAKEPSTHQDLPTNDTTHIDGLPPVDDWRQYPAFPSAYPPTPLVKQTQLATATIVSASNTMYSSISEEPAQQGFRPSLLLQHNNSNPSYAGDRSDEIDIHGVQTDEEITISVMDVDGDDALDEDRADEYESEDEFNVTLRTPDAPLRILTSLGVPRPLSSEISPLSLPSIGSSALTTADGESSLCTPSTEAPTPPPKPPGYKRALYLVPPVANARVRTSRVMARGTSVKVARPAKTPVNRAVVSQRRSLRSRQSAGVRTHEQPGLHDPENELLPSLLDSEELTSKRRRVSLSPPTAVQVTEPVKRRVVRPTSTSTKMTRIMPAQKPPSLRPLTKQPKTNVKLSTISSREGSVVPEDPSLA